ncbi:hypothetical protein PISMIDRAFT_438827 [Pisolithus microcarpus 441]|uniref:Uncharacterized protein n=1 Tax=Pisolithus microcarpus 441 TaxID=765257 RepID=A0A0D0ACA7_9AGAM|nr:hypothetical protein PISMIDRAFT_438827 [Pisolithus microcarpus 441]
MDFGCRHTHKRYSYRNLKFIGCQIACASLKRRRERFTEESSHIVLDSAIIFHFLQGSAAIKLSLIPETLKF